MSQEAPRALIKTIEKIVDLTVVILLLALLLYGGYSMWDANRMYSAASSEVYAPYRPTREEELGFEQLQQINPDVFGWITVYGTHVDYPLVQGTDNLKYVHTNARGEAAMSGAIFLDFRNNQNFTDFNNIIYGHDMARNAMFGDINNFYQEYFFESRRFGMIFTGEEYYGLEIFAFMFVDAHDFGIYNPTMTEPAIKEVFMERIFAEAIHVRELEITTNDRIVLMSTCTPTATNGRHVLVARLMDEVPEDIFGGAYTGSGADSFFGLDINLLGLGLGLLIVIGVTVPITLSVAKKKKKKKMEAEISPEDEIEAELINERRLKKKKQKKQKKPLSLGEELLFLFGKIVMIMFMLALLFILVFGVTRVDDMTMAPAMQEGDIVFFQRIGQDYLATDAVVLRYNGEMQVRRVVAVAGDTVDITENQGLVINGLPQQELHIFEETTQFAEGVTFPLVVPEGEVFVLGDSRARSRDSRIYGTVRVDDILGSVVTVIRRRDL